MAKGTKFGRVHGRSLDDLFLIIRKRPYKVEHKQTLYAKGEWHIIFTVMDDFLLDAVNEPELNKTLNSKNK